MSDANFDVVEHTLASAVANAGTFTINYPTGKDAGAYGLGSRHKMVSNAYGAFEATADDFDVTFGTADITITNKTGNAWAAGTKFWIELDQAGGDETEAFAATEKMATLKLVNISLGAPDAADADGVCASQAGTAATAMTIAGALASGGVATFDVPRNVVGAWTNTAVLTVTGTDEYGNVVVESSASGTSMAGKKAFKTITAVTPSANITGATVGTGDVLGLPVYLPGAAAVLGESQDGAKATAGTTVAGVLTSPATATTGDVRGTYDPNAACDGAKKFDLVVAVANPGFKGVAQYAG